MNRSWLGLIGLWLLILVTVLLVRPPFPVDETRYLAVAWEMWWRDDFLVPRLNGETYSHKPPLLFWLMHAGWWLFGVNDWWPRLIAPLFSLLDLALLVWLARLLWPQDFNAHRHAVWFLFGTLLWLGFYTLIQFDLLLTGCTLLGVIGLVTAAKGERLGWLWLSLGLGLGGLAKGPVILLHLLPLALLAPAWLHHRRPASWWRWYLGVMASVVAGVGLAMAWAWPAAQAGGEAYRQAIFWGQHAGRMTAEADHAQPVWHYLLMLPVLLLPWWLAPSLWRALKGIPRDDGVRLCLTWALATFVLFSLVSGKQGKYLLPMFPALALLAGRAWAVAGGGRRLRPWLPGVIALLAGALIMAAPWFAEHAQWLAGVNPLWGVVPVVVGAALLAARPWAAPDWVARTAVTGVMVVVVAQWSLVAAMVPAYDLRAMSERIATLQGQGRAVALTREYHGQYHLFGRLRQPLGPVVPDPELATWAAAHPDDYILLRGRDWPGRYQGAEYAQPFRSGALVLWSGTALAAWLEQAGEAGA